MSARKLVLGIDSSVIKAFLLACETQDSPCPGEGLERKASAAIDGPEGMGEQEDGQLSAARLVVALAEIGEWRLIASASQMQDICQWLTERSLGEGMANRLFGLLEKAIDIAPVEACHLKAAIANGGESISSAVLAECAKSMGAVAVLAMPSTCTMLSRQGIPAMTPCAFFDELERRYGLEYAEIEI